MVYNVCECLKLWSPRSELSSSIPTHMIKKLFLGKKKIISLKVNRKESIVFIYGFM